MATSELKSVLDEIGGGIKSIQQDNKRIDKRLDEFGDRIEAIESGKDRPHGGGGGTKGVSAKDREHGTVFTDWMRDPTNERCKMRLSEAQHELGLESKDVQTGTGSLGGHGLPKYISDQIENRVRQLNPLRQLANVQNISTSMVHFLVGMGDGTSGWVSEVGSRTATNATTLRDRAPTTGELYAYPTASNWSLQDVQFNVEQFLVADVSADFASQEATAFLSGSGTNRPTGILNTAPVTTADSASPVRNADAIQYIPLTSPPSPLRVTFDSLIDLVGTVAERYLVESDKVAWLMHRTTVSAIRKLKASTAGSYLWEQDGTARAPLNLLGFPVYTCDAVPTNVAGNIAAIFGNFARGYLIVDRSPISITVDPYTTPGQTKFYVRKRVGGRILNNDAIKALKLV